MLIIIKRQEIYKQRLQIKINFKPKKQDLSVTIIKSEQAEIKQLKKCSIIGKMTSKKLHIYKATFRIHKKD